MCLLIVFVINIGIYLITKIYGSISLRASSNTSLKPIDFPFLAFIHIKICYDTYNNSDYFLYISLLFYFIYSTTC